MDSKEHTEYCTAFVQLTQSSTQDEYKQRLEYLRLLDEGETRYIEATWLDIWKTRIVHCWTKEVTHVGMQTTSRVEGYHATMKRWLCNSTADLLTIHDRMTIWWKDSVEQYEQAIADSEHGILNSFRKPLYAGVVKLIHNHALKICHALLLKNPSARPCTGEYRHTHGLPCIHELHAHKERNEQLAPSLFHGHWWVDRNRSPDIAPPRVLEPRTIADLPH